MIKLFFNRNKNLLSKLLWVFRDREILIADGLNEAVIGFKIVIVENNEYIKLIYSIEKCIDILVERDGMTPNIAVEFLEFNTVGAYVGHNTPIWEYNFDDE